MVLARFNESSGLKYFGTYEYGVDGYMVTPVMDHEQRVGFSTTTSLENARFIIFQREAALRGLWYGRSALLMSEMISTTSG